MQGASMPLWKNTESGISARMSRASARVRGPRAWMSVQQSPSLKQVKRAFSRTRRGRGTETTGTFLEGIASPLSDAGLQRTNREQPFVARSLRLGAQPGGAHGAIRHDDALHA